MIDLLQATEFIPLGNGKYMNKLSNGVIYSEAELKELLRKNNKEVMQVGESDEVKPKATQTTKRHTSTKRTRN